MIKKVFILSLTSDIGSNLAAEYVSRGWEVFGTYRNLASQPAITSIIPESNLWHCDISNTISIRDCLISLPSDLSWDLFISLPCDPLPLSSFYNSNIDEWIDSFLLNSLRQLHFLHGIYPLRNQTQGNPTVIFTAGGGTNNSVAEFSAYTSAKIHLIKMIELLAYEDPLCKYAIVGPGWTNTKTHKITLDNTEINSKRHHDVKNFLNDPKKGTTYEEIINCLDWIYEQPIKSISGRNISVVYDNWEGSNSSALESLLAKDENLYKLRRSGNDILPPRLR